MALERLDRYLAGVSSQSRSPQYWQAQTLLAQAYRGSGQMDEAVDLCEQLASQSNPETQQWAQQFLASIFASLEQAKQAAEQAAAEAEAEAQRLQAIEQARIEPRRVSELKQFYKKTLLPELKKVEKSRRSTLISVLIISAIFLAIFIYSATLTFQWPKIFFISSSIWLTLWIFFYSFRTSQYGFGFKRDVIQKLLEFMDSDGYLKYSPTGELGAARKALMKSTLLGELFPDIVHQDDYVSGTVGRTRLCFTDVCAEKSSITLLSLFKEGRGSEKTFWIASLVVVVFGFPYAFSRIARGRKLVFSEFWEHFYDSSISKRLLFKGLLYWSDFSKTFKSRTVIIPNKITERISKNGAINGLNRIKLEDPQFNKYFLVYGEDQVEARYILSTNLMHRIANLRKKLNRDICLSFVSYTMYITINYEEDLFEPKIFSSMLSFKPILEYFEIFQMAIAIVDDLRLNRRIWDAD
ncbi:MAG: DUF3137 domain-containing protein [Cyanobacteria bacterium SID2]|nr:DUF3137 domain-containing protein [Cyanobacteria bacterium SID2]MBP0003848.1 DUF3137 domain-containing protein [Cyanobacteria bacterium SBC]